MNEKFKKLADECGLGVKHGGIVLTKNVNAEVALEKFAELIVRECAGAIDKVNDDAPPDHGCMDWATFASGDDVLAHFGLAEK